MVGWVWSREGRGQGEGVGMVVRDWEVGGGGKGWEGDEG
jgi:hypothetical protein